MRVRRYTPADRPWVAAALGAGADAAIDGATHRIEVVEDGADRALGLWVAPGPGRLAFLGPVLSTRANRPDLFNAAIVAVCEAGLAEGFTKGTTRVNDRRVVRLLERDFDVTFTPGGTNVTTGRIGHWQLEVELAEIVATARRKGLV